MISHQVSLRNRNTLAIDVLANTWLQYNDLTELQNYRLVFGAVDIFPFGEGSNLVLCNDVRNICIRSVSQRIEIVESKNDVFVIVDAGANWNHLVRWCLQHACYGLESLYGIPGSCGAAPVQNIGAYGAEFADICEWVEYFDWKDNVAFRIKASECGFGYRSSVFKHKPHWVITRFCLRLTRSLLVWQHWRKQCIQHSSLVGVEKYPESKHPNGFAELVLQKRRQKLPDPLDQPNVGSFFHNPVIDIADFQQLFANLLHIGAAWRLSPTRGKISAAWLIDNCVGRGFRIGKCAISQQHALCLTNLGGATGTEIIAFACCIQQKVVERYGINLVIEPTIVSSRS